MPQLNRFALLTLTLILVAACGPDTIFLRPALDTPQQHVKNGHSLLTRGKIDAANAEFIRAKNLDDDFVPAYVGLALIQGHRGNFDGGFDYLDQARTRVITPEDAKEVDRGFESLQKMQSSAKN